MKYSEWRSFYKEIKDDLDLNFEGDIEGAELLNSYLVDNDAEERARVGIKNKDVLVCGDGGSLESELKTNKFDVLLTADAAIDRLPSDYRPDIHLTDLDGAPEEAIKASFSGCILVIHAHGDNLDLIQRYISKFDKENVIGTTQTEPFGKLRNYGGFTDGDRAVFMADEFGARSIDTAGFNLDDSSVSRTKKEKLEWCRKLISYIEKERGEEIL